MTTFPGYDQSYYNFKLARAQVTKTLAQIANEVNSGAPELEARVSPLHGEIDVNLGAQKKAQDEYILQLDILIQLDKVVGRSNKRTIKNSVASVGFFNAYAAFLSARSRVDGILVQIDDALIQADVKKVISLMPELLSVLDGEATAQQTYLDALDVIEGKSASGEVIDRAQFDALTPSKKSKYIRLGGKIVDQTNRK